MNKTFFDKEMEFADACNIHRGDINGQVNEAAVALADSLVEEEWNRETHPALQKYLRNPSLENLVEVADGIADTIYVLCQLARALDIPLNEIYDEVHRANMAKVGPEGKVTLRSDGKILKPAGWKAPDIWYVLYSHSNRRAVEMQQLGSDNWDEGKKR